MTKEELASKLKISLNKDNNTSDILFFTGAGISAPDPCSFPLGQELHRILLQYYTDMTSWEIEGFLNQNPIPFERTVEIILEEYGNLDHQNRGFNLLTEIFIYRNNEANWKEDNDYHKYFRHHVQQGGKHFTVNLDQFIELEGQGIQTLTANDIDDENGAFNAENFDQSGFLFKIHGDSNLDPVGLQGFLHRVIRNGFTDEVQNFFDRQIQQVNTVIFVGYGGVDQFDITPYFENKPNCFFKNTRALWINYSRENEISISENLSQSQQTILSKFSDWACVQCSPEIILNSLFNNNSPDIGTAHRNNGYRREYENFFRINTTQEIVDNDQNIEDNNLREYMLRRRRIRGRLI